MKNLSLLLVLLFFFLQKTTAQVTCQPVFPTVEDDVTITFTASEGNGALATTPPPIYAHMGVITTQSSSGSDWKYVATTWGTADSKGSMTTVSPGVYQKSFNIRSFFGIPAGVTVLKLAFVFRNQDGSIVGRASDGSDIFYPIYPSNSALVAAILKPTSALNFLQPGAQLAVEAAASQTASLTLLDNGQQIAAANGKSLNHTLAAGAPGLHKVEFVATTATEKDTASFTYLVPGAVVSENLPAGTELGITDLGGQGIRLALYAPLKKAVHVMGDFNNWQPTLAHQMKRTPDGSTWWLDLSGLTPGQPLRFQYLVDGVLKIADPLSTLVLDPWNDGFVPPLTFPDLPPYPADKTTGIVSVFTPGATPFDWQTTSYVRPKKTDLVIYELLLRDFLARQDYQTLLDTLDYLQNLGVTAIELMPVNEFDGNISWGYNPAFHKALDKFYGSPTAFKTLVDECHRRGMAVILDVVFNHATGASPLAQLYWDAANNRPSLDNPWLNPTAKHDFNVFHDFNHENGATKNYVKNCLKYWLTEYRVDGFRFDLSKGFTQKNTLGNPAAMAAYDASRVAIWKNYASSIWTTDPTVYIILEHFADNSEEKELADYGMMIWGKIWEPYKNMALGHPSSLTANFDGVSWKNRQYAAPHLIGYMESHDEDRIGYECKTFGASASNYNVKNLSTATARMAMLNNIFYTVPGPKMLWQFGELGYDFSINHCTNGTVDPACRLDPKPIRWDFFQQPERRNLYNRTLALLHLRNSQSLFETTDFQIISVAGGQGRVVKLNSPDLNALAISNVGITAATIPASFQHTGKWYDYYTGDSITVGSPNTDLNFQPGEYRLYLDRFVPLPPGGDLVGASDFYSNIAALAVFPNPATDRLHVVFDLKNSAWLRVELFDLRGQRFRSLGAGDFQAGENWLETDLSGLPQGLYFLKISGEGGFPISRKVLKF